MYTLSLTVKLRGISVILAQSSFSSDSGSNLDAIREDTCPGMCKSEKGEITLLWEVWWCFRRQKGNVWGNLRQVIQPPLFLRWVCARRERCSNLPFLPSRWSVLWIQQTIIQLQIPGMPPQWEWKLNKLVTKKLPLIPGSLWIHCNPRNWEMIFTQRLTLIWDPSLWACLYGVFVRSKLGCKSATHQPAEN